jgi:hypothetical protein
MLDGRPFGRERRIQWNSAFIWKAYLRNREKE